MKEKHHIWEADIRKKTLDHEFDYDSKAWDDMSLLLDEAAIPVADSKAGSVTDFSIGGSWKGIAFTLFIVGALALWFLSGQESTTSDLSTQFDTTTRSESLTEEEGESKLPSSTSINEEKNDLVETVSTKSISYKNKVSDRQSAIADSPEQIIDIEKTDKLMENAIDKKEESSPQRKSIEALELLPNIKIPLLKIPRKPVKLEMELSKNKRGRDKNKLYPDVIENY